MFSREDLECLDSGYFEIIYMNDRDVTIMSRNTRHVETVVLLSQLKQKPDDYINVTIERECNCGGIEAL